MRLDLPGLYRRQGPYWYRNGWNPCAMLALAAGIAPCLPGFANTAGLADVGSIWSRLYDYAWFVSFGVAFVSYFALMKLSRSAARS
jgi:NCS1 family nucleobase:cation symporter-1